MQRSVEGKRTFLYRGPDSRYNFLDVLDDLEACEPKKQINMGKTNQNDIDKDDGNCSNEEEEIVYWFDFFTDNNK